MSEYGHGFEPRLKTILNYLKEDYLGEYSDERFRPLKVEFSPYISKKLEEIDLL